MIPVEPFYNLLVKTGTRQLRARAHVATVTARLVLHDMSIYRIDIEYELNIDYEYLLKPTSNDIENGYRAQFWPQSVLCFRY